MKTKIFIVLIAVATLMSCNSNKNTETGEHEEHEGPEGVVMLNELQREALNLKLGNFEMRNLTTLVKTNGQLEVPPAASADVTAVIGGNVKEIKVFQERMTKQIELLKSIPCSAKFGGATGNFNAHVVTYPEIDWVEFANRFVNDVLGLDRSQTTTQIEHYDNRISLFEEFVKTQLVFK